MLTIEQPGKQKAWIEAKLPSHLHVASIMNERTNEERSKFGKVNINEMKMGDKDKG